MDSTRGKASDSVNLISILQLGQVMIGSVMPDFSGHKKTRRFVRTPKGIGMAGVLAEVSARMTVNAIPVDSAGEQQTEISNTSLLYLQTTRYGYKNGSISLVSRI